MTGGVGVWCLPVGRTALLDGPVIPIGCKVAANWNKQPISETNFWILATVEGTRAKDRYLLRDPEGQKWDTHADCPYLHICHDHDHVAVSLRVTTPWCGILPQKWFHTARNLCAIGGGGCGLAWTLEIWMHVLRKCRSPVCICRGESCRDVGVAHPL